MHPSCLIRNLRGSASLSQPWKISRETGVLAQRPHPSYIVGLPALGSRLGSGITGNGTDMVRIASSYEKSIRTTTNVIYTMRTMDSPVPRS